MVGVICSTLVPLIYQMPVPDFTELGKIREEFKTETPIDSKTEVKTEVKTDAPATDGKVETPADEVKVNPLAELPEDAFMAELERRGMKVSKETLTDEQKKKAEEIELANKIKFGVEQGIITHDKYNELQSIINSEGADLTKKEFTKSYKAENKNATAEEIAQAFNDYYWVNQTVKDKKFEVKENEETGEKEIIESDFERPKYGEKEVKWGETRIKTAAERTKAEAQKELENLNTSYANYQTAVSRWNDYEKSKSEVLSSIDLSAYPTKHKVKGKEISAIVKFEKPEEVRKDLEGFLTEKIGGLIINSDKQKDIAEIKRHVNSYLKEKYSEQFDSTLWDLGKSQGLNEGKVGASAPLEREIISDDTVISALEASVESRLPKNPLLDKNKK